MGAYVKKGETKRIELPDGEWVEIKKRFTWGEIKEFKEKRSESGFLARAIVNWNVTGEDGEVLEITSEILDCLDVVVLARISQEVKEIVSPLSQTAEYLMSKSGLSLTEEAKQ